MRRRMKKVRSRRHRRKKGIGNKVVSIAHLDLSCSANNHLGNQRV
jgi:hypothetical protein